MMGKANAAMGGFVLDLFEPVAREAAKAGFELGLPKFNALRRKRTTGDVPRESLDVP